MKRSALFLFTSCLILSGSTLAHAQTAIQMADPQYWANVDDQMLKAGVPALTDAGMNQVIDALTKSTNEEQRALGMLMRRARYDKDLAMKLQNAIYYTRSLAQSNDPMDKSGQVKDFRYPFAVDGDFGKRSVYEMSRLYTDENNHLNSGNSEAPKQDPHLIQNALKTALNNAGLGLNKDTIARLEKEEMTAAPQIRAVKDFPLQGPPSANCPPPEPMPQRMPAGRHPQMPSADADGDEHDVAQERGGQGHANTPQKMLRDAMSEPLQLVGKGQLPNGNDHIPGCVYKNSKVYVVYEYCGGLYKSMGEEAVGVTIYSVTGGSVRMYLEGGQRTQGRQMSQLKREQYDGTWKIEYHASRPLNPGMSMGQFAGFYGQDQNSLGSGNSCTIGGVLQRLDRNNAACNGPSAGQLGSTWMPAAREFWQNPPPAWYQFIGGMHQYASGAR